MLVLFISLVPFIRLVPFIGWVPSIRKVRNIFQVLLIRKVQDSSRAIYYSGSKTKGHLTVAPVIMMFLGISEVF